MEHWDPTDPNLDGDFIALIKRRETAKQQINKERDLKAIYAKQAVATMGNKRATPSKSTRQAPPAELFEIRCKIFEAAESDSGDQLQKEYMVLHNHRTYSKMTLSDPDLRDPGDNHTVLHHAIIHKNETAIEYLLEVGDGDMLMEEYNVQNGTIQSMKNALHLLVELGNASFIQIFLRKIQRSPQKNNFLKKSALMEIEGQRPRQLTPIHIAALNGNTGVLDQLIDAGMSVNIQNSKNDTPLIWAARWNHIETASRLLDLGADSSIENDKFSTPLYWAIRYGYPDMVKLLLTKGNADVNFRRKHGFEVLVVLAAALDYNEILQILLDNSADVNVKTSSGLTALHVAALYGNNNILDTLLENNPRAQIEASDNLGNTALMYAVKGGHLITAINLLSAGANVHCTNVYGETIWDAAIDSKDKEILDVLVDFYKASRGMEDHLTFPKGKTPLHLAAVKGKVEDIEMLLNKGCDARAVDCGGNTFYHVAARENKVKILETFIDKVDINQQNNDGSTPIHLACQQGHMESVLILMKKARLDLKNKLKETLLHCCAKCKADTAPAVAGKVLAAMIKTQSWSMMDSQNLQGDTALHIAARNGNPQLIQELSSLNPKVKNKDGLNPLHVAAMEDSRELLKHMLAVFLLPSTGLNINDAKGDGETLLHICAKAGDAETLQILIRKGADLTKTDTSGNTVLHDLVQQSTIDRSNNEQHLKVFQTVVDNCTQWWCTKQDLFFPDKGTSAYKDIQRDALIHLTEDVYNSMNLSVKTYASYLAATEVLQAIFNIPGVFCFKGPKYYKYDVSNVSPETMVDKVTTKNSKKSKLSVQPAPMIIDDEDQDDTPKDEIQPPVTHSESCLDVIVKMENLVRATKVLDVIPINYIVEDYWNVYRFIYGILMLLHIAYMSVYTAYSIPLSTQVWTASNSTVVPNPAYAWFIVPPIIILLFAFYFIAISMIALCSKKSVGTLSDEKKTCCSGGPFGFFFQIFEVLLDSLFLISGVLFSMLVIVWYILYMMAHKDQVYVLSSALLVGWAYTIAYSKGFQTVHAFAIMLREIIVRDITRFSFIFSFILLAFGFSMHALFQISPVVSSNYPTFAHTLFETFNLMIGMGEVVNENTDEEFSSVGSTGVYLRVVYLLYMISSSIILLNLLIAMMSDSYNSIKSNEGTTWRVGSVKMAISIEHSMTIIGSIFHCFRTAQSRIPITFNVSTMRYMITVPISEIEQIVQGEEHATTETLHVLESKLNFMNNNIMDLNHKFTEIMDMLKMQGTLHINEKSSSRKKKSKRKVTEDQ